VRDVVAIYSFEGHSSPACDRDVRTNQLTGSIPSSYGNLKNVWHLYGGAGSYPVSRSPYAADRRALQSNKLTGAIPDSFSNLTNLQRLCVLDWVACW
jgi:hypothetical protein